MNVLIVEDAFEMREVLKNIIHVHLDNTIAVYEAENGVEALEILGQYPIDILLTDIMMPVMDGFELVRRVKSNEQLQSVFIVAITGLSGEEEMKKIFSCGADYYISKPIQEEDIVTRLKLIHKLVSKEHTPPLFVRDTFNPFIPSDLKNYYIIFTLLQESDIYQMFHTISALYANINKIKLKDFIALLLKSYESLHDSYHASFEMMLETSDQAIYITCTHSSFMDAFKRYENSLPIGYTIMFMKNSMTIEIPIEGA